MFSLKRHLGYVQTGLACSPRMPSHWTLARNKSVMKRRVELVGSNSRDYKLLSLTKQGVIVRDLSTGKGKMPTSFDTYQRVEPGDLVMCLFDVDETPRTVGIASDLGMVTGAYDRFVVADRTTAAFLTWFYIAIDNVKGLRSLYKGLRKTVPVDDFLASKVPLPPADEQAAIVKYLAHANARIDGAISAKQREIALLAEFRTRLICGVVTGQVDVRDVAETLPDTDITAPLTNPETTSGLSPEEPLPSPLLTEE